MYMKFYVIYISLSIMGISQQMLLRRIGIIVRMFKSVVFCSSALKIIESGKFYTETKDEKILV